MYELNPFIECQNGRGEAEREKESRQDGGEERERNTPYYGD